MARRKARIPDFPLFQGAKKKKKRKKATVSSPFTRGASWVLAPTKPKKKTKAKSTTISKSATPKSTTKKSTTTKKPKTTTKNSLIQF